MYYYRVNGQVCCSLLADLPYEKLDSLPKAERVFFLFDREIDSCKSSFCVNHPSLFFAQKEDVSWLNENKLESKPCEDGLLDAVKQGVVTAVNIRHPRFLELLSKTRNKEKKRVNVLALGDVGSTLLTGLHLLGGDVISSIGICDVSEQVTARWEMEANQIGYPWQYDALPEVEVISPDQLFDCDMFVFVASKGIPPVGSDVKDVRMYQFEANSAIVSQYARQAREKGFRGLFAVVSDPVDPLAKAAFLASNQNQDGEFDGLGLLAEQIQGYGLGVMNARAAYYAKRNPHMKQFLTEGRSFGPHGQDLVIADSIANYDDQISKELTELTVTANLKVRAVGYKPFIAPAYSSGAISLLLTLRGQWHCGSVYLGGIFMGVKNRYTPAGLETEILPLPQPLYDRIVHAQDNLKQII